MVISNFDSYAKLDSTETKIYMKLQNKDQICKI